MTEPNLETDLDFSCPSCGDDLASDVLFLHWRVCSSCNRHFAMPAAERAAHIVDPGSFRALHTQVVADDDTAAIQPSAMDRLAGARERAVVQEAIVTGTGELGGSTIIVIALDDQLVGNQIGALGAEKIIQALDHAQSRHMPVVMIVAGGSSALHLGPLAVVQSGRIASAATQVQALGIPIIGILTHPTSAAVFNSMASLCDLIFAEPGTSVGVVWAADRPIDAMQQAMSEDALLDHGWIDGVIARQDQHDRLAGVLSLVSRHSAEIPVMASTLPTDLDRPLVEYLDVVAAPFTELRGDRVECDDRGVVTGIGAIEGMPIAIAVQDSRVNSNAAAVIRKIQRLARFAGRFELPLVMVVDGAQPEQPYVVTPGDSFAAAKLSATMSVVPIPVVSVGVGRIQGLVSSLMMFGDSRLMAEHATYRLSGGKSTAFIPAGHPRSDTQEWSARECVRMGLVDRVIEMPPGGASADPWLAVRMLREDVHTAAVELSRLGQRRLIERRAHAHRELGRTEAGIATVFGELREWQDVQQSLRGSIDEWRDRLEQRMNTSEWREKLEQRPQLANIQRPDLGEIGARLKARQERLRNEIIERTRGDHKESED